MSSPVPRSVITNLSEGPSTPSSEATGFASGREDEANESHLMTLVTMDAQQAEINRKLQQLVEVVASNSRDAAGGGPTMHSKVAKSTGKAAEKPNGSKSGLESYLETDLKSDRKLDQEHETSTLVSGTVSALAGGVKPLDRKMKTLHRELLKDWAMWRPRNLSGTKNQAVFQTFISDFEDCVDPENVLIKIVRKVLADSLDGRLAEWFLMEDVNYVRQTKWATYEGFKEDLLREITWIGREPQLGSQVNEPTGSPSSSPKRTAVRTIKHDQTVKQPLVIKAAPRRRRLRKRNQARPTLDPKAGQTNSARIQKQGNSNFNNNRLQPRNQSKRPIGSATRQLDGPKPSVNLIMGPFAYVKGRESSFSEPSKAADAPSTAERTIDNNCPMHRITINGYTYHALLVTGANINVVHPRVIKEIGAEVQSVTPITIHGIYGNFVAHNTTHLRIPLHRNRWIDAEFLVAPILFDIIIGVRTIRAVGLSIVGDHTMLGYTKA